MNRTAFAIHRADLSRKRERCVDAVESASRLPKEIVSACNLCGCGQQCVIALRDRYGCPIRTAFCMNCGLVYVVDRLTRDSHSAFYETGIYRDLISGFKSAKQSPDILLRSQRYYAERLVTALRGLLPEGGGRVLDAGGSTGLVAAEFQRAFGHQPVLFDPSPAEVEEARRLGIEAYVGTVETFESAEPFDLVLLCRTIEHVFDLRESLIRLRGLVRPGGLFYCDFSDYMEVCRREGPPEATSKVDHCYWLIQDRAEAMFRSLGFEVVAINTTMSAEQVGYLLQPCLPTPMLPADRNWIHARIQEFREIQTAWERDSQEALDMRDWLKVRAYRAKLMLFKASL